MDVQGIIDAAKSARGFSSDNQLAIAIGTTRAAVSGWRHSKHLPDTLACEKLADFSGIPLHRVLGIVGEARAISAAEKKVWRRLATALFVSMVVAFPAHAADLNAGSLSALCVVAWVTMRVTFYSSNCARTLCTWLFRGFGHGSSALLA